MKRLWRIMSLLLLSGALTVPGWADEGPVPATTPDERIENGLLPPILIKGKSPQRFSVHERMKHYKVQGLSLAVIDQWQIVWARGWGIVKAGSEEPVTPQTLFQAGSVSKPVTGLVALRLVASGDLALEQPVNDALKSWKVPDSESGGTEPVRLHHLLTHSAGFKPYTFPGFKSAKEMPPMVQMLEEGVERIEPPGRRYAYSNPAFAVLEQVLVDVTGKPLAELAQTHVFEPLGMSGSSFAAELPPPLLARAAYPHDNTGELFDGRGLVLPAGLGGLWSTPSDLCSFLLGIFKANRQQTELLPQELAAGMVTRRLDSRSLGIELVGEGEARRVMHGGGLPGFVAFVVGYPETGQGAAVMVNGAGWNLMHEVLRSVAVEYAWPGYVTEYEVIAVAPEILTRYAGRYRFDVQRAVEVPLSVRDGALCYGSDEVEMLPVSKTKFVIPEHGVELELMIDEGGQATGFLYGQPGTRKIRADRIE